MDYYIIMRLFHILLQGVDILWSRRSTRLTPFADFDAALSKFDCDVCPFRCVLN